jgi:hypothetical protein
MAVRYYQVARDSVACYTLNAIDRTQAVAHSVHVKPVEEHEDSALVPDLPHPQPTKASPPETSNPPLDSGTVMKECKDRSFTTFCENPSYRIPGPNSPSIRLQRGCPLCFPPSPPEVISKLVHSPLCHQPNLSLNVSAITGVAFKASTQSYALMETLNRSAVVMQEQATNQSMGHIHSSCQRKHWRMHAGTWMQSATNLRTSPKTKRTASQG